MNCERCGASDWSVVEKTGALETWRCKVCGTEELVHVNPSMPPGGFVAKDPVVEVTVQWMEKPTAASVGEAQKVFPALRKLSAMDIFRAARESRGLVAGRLTQADLAQARERLQPFAIKVEGAPL